jgi:hypothetical protein
MFCFIEMSNLKAYHENLILKIEQFMIFLHISEDLCALHVKCPHHIHFSLSQKLVVIAVTFLYNKYKPSKYVVLQVLSQWNE